MTVAGAAVLKNEGFCPICARSSTFVAKGEWLRDQYLCVRCGSVPRERALMSTVETQFPHWRELAIHESSPVRRGASLKLARECARYQSSRYFAELPLGAHRGGVRCENLEALTFADASFDVHITQDVMEHVLDPASAFREIARTLRPGGAHIFTTPLVNRSAPSRVRARRDESGRIVNLEEPIYHGNPIDKRGSLVTVDWGFDICQRIFEACGLLTQTIHIDDLSRGIRAEYNEVLVTIKPAATPAGDRGDPA
ncbi:MAG: class I SAM-dependent methyltransferase [Burkholderiaceae bacterium]|nr:class I SAM-dependent methyltransferase [Burkholderiaceae bacterium]